MLIFNPITSTPSTVPKVPVTDLLRLTPDRTYYVFRSRGAYTVVINSFGLPQYATLTGKGKKEYKNKDPELCLMFSCVWQFSDSKQSMS